MDCRNLTDRGGPESLIAKGLVSKYGFASNGISYLMLERGGEQIRPRPRVQNLLRFRDTV